MGPAGSVPGRFGCACASMEVTAVVPDESYSNSTGWKNGERKVNTLSEGGVDGLVSVTLALTGTPPPTVTSMVTKSQSSSDGGPFRHSG